MPLPSVRRAVALDVVAVVLLTVILLAVAPLWPWSRGWGWAPAGMVAMGLGTMIVFSLTVVPE